MLDSLVGELVAILKINLGQLRAVLGKGLDGLVHDEDTSAEIQLLERCAALG